MGTEQEMLTALKNGNAKAFEELYVRYYRMVSHLIDNLGGKEEDAQDIFQEALFVLVKKIREPDFQLTGKISTLLFAISRNLYLKKRKKGNNELSMEDRKLIQVGDDTDEPVDHEEKELMIAILLDKLNSMDEDCRNVLQAVFFKNLPHAEIAKLTGYSEAFVKVKKFRCLEYLRKLVKASPFFRN
jgi:RNA polymerase sigma factor (sigma-70 family)